MLEVPLHISLQPLHMSQLASSASLWVSGLENSAPPTMQHGRDTHAAGWSFKTSGEGVDPSPLGHPWENSETGFCIMSRLPCWIKLSCTSVTSFLPDLPMNIFWTSQVNYLHLGMASGKAQVKIQPIDQSAAKGIHGNKRLRNFAKCVSPPSSHHFQANQSGAQRDKHLALQKKVRSMIFTFLSAIDSFMIGFANVFISHILLFQPDLSPYSFPNSFSCHGSCTA